MMKIDDAPWIKNPERYAPEPELCPNCGEAMNGTVFEVDGEWVCLDCFCEWVRDVLKTNPEDIANALDVRTQRW